MNGQKMVLSQWVDPAVRGPGPSLCFLLLPQFLHNRADFPTLEDSGPQCPSATFAITQREFLLVSSWRKPRWPTWLGAFSPLPKSPAWSSGQTGGSPLGSL